MSELPPPASPAETEELLEGGEEQRHGLTARQRQVAGVLTQLAATARSFLLYDPRNAAIHQHLSRLLDSIVGTLSEFGQIELTVQPFEVVFEDQPVYLNRDREKSLAFRLYRDGVRGLTFRDGFEWEQLARLLEVLSVRYSGVHQNEDDMVTLLWKANFTHLNVVAVEGFVPEDESTGEPAGGGGLRAEAGPTEEDSAFPELHDLPPPSLPKPERVSFVVVPETALATLRAESSSAALPSDCIRLIEHLRRLLSDPTEKLQFDQVAHIVTEIRDFLLADEHLAPLTRVIRTLKELAAEPDPAWDPGRRAAVSDSLSSCGDYRAVQRLLHSVPGERRTLHQELIQVLDLACPDPLSVVAAVLAAERSVAARAIARQLLEHYGKGRAEDLTRRFREAEGPVAGDLLRVIAHVGGSSAAPTIAQQCAHPAHEVQEEALWHIERMPYSGAIGRLLFDAYRRADATQGRILALIAKSGDRRFVELLAHDLEGKASHFALEEAAEVGRVMGRLAGVSGIERWKEWLRPAGLLKKALGAPVVLQVAAAAALGETPGDEPEAVLRAAAAAASPEAHAFIHRALGQHQAARRKESR